MKKSSKVVLGIVTFWPPVWMVLFVVSMVGMFFISDDNTAESRNAGAPWAIILFFGLHGLTMLTIFGLMAFYLVHLFKHSNIPEDKRILWLLVIIMGGIVGAPVYWYLHIWKADDVTSPPN